jgi:monoamine oxidase
VQFEGGLRLAGAKRPVDPHQHRTEGTDGRMPAAPAREPSAVGFTSYDRRNSEANVVQHRVVVVGAGLAGLTAARELDRRGVDVIVLEAADRVGGRAMSETSALGSRLDLGGQWIGRGHHRVSALARDLGETEFRMHTTAMPVVVDGARRVSPVSIPVLTAAGALLGVALLVLVGVPRRWRTTTIHAWLQRVPGRTARRLIEVAALVSWTADLDRVTVHSMTTMIRRQGGLRTMLSTDGGAQESLLVEGAGTLAERLAAGLGDRVRTGTPVRSIHRDDAGVTVHTDTEQIAAAKVIVTVPPPMAAHIAHDPALPDARRALERDTFMGTVYKAIAVYDRPFWRDRRGGEFVVLGSPGGVVFDTTAPDGPGHLCFLASGADARALDAFDPDERVRAVLAPLAAHVGAEVLHPASWHEKSWHRDEFVGGGYMALPEPTAAAAAYPMSATPVGHVHWAGTETAQDHPGYLDGAIESGHRVAREVAALLR